MNEQIKTEIGKKILSIYDFSLHELETWIKEQGEKSFRAAQIYDWLYVKRASSFSQMSNLPKRLREKLEVQFKFLPLIETAKYESHDGTSKFLFTLHDGHAIETVIMRYKYGNSVCVTTQVGCKIGCTFCASTLGGLKRDLSTGEIVAQVVQAQKILDARNERVSHVVIMGIGEPFENYEHLMQFLYTIMHPQGLNIGARHITVSTSGIIPNIRRFAEESLQVNLAISLHAPNDELRSKLMPVNRRFPFLQLMEACRYYFEKTGRRITIEYALIGGVNDQVEHASELADVLRPLTCHVNLIPVNYVPERNYVRTTRDQVFAFQHELQRKNINVTIRREQGHDIEAACGQLRAKHTKIEGANKRASVR